MTKPKPKKIGKIKRLRMHLHKQSYLIDQIIMLQKKLQTEYPKALTKLEKLDQGKTYWLYTENDQETIMNMINETAIGIPWKMPLIIVSSEKLETLSETKLKKLLKEVRKK